MFKYDHAYTKGLKISHIMAKTLRSIVFLVPLSEKDLVLAPQARQNSARFFLLKAVR